MVVITLKLILTAIFIYGLHADITMIAVASVISQCFFFLMALRNLASESVGIVMGVSNYCPVLKYCCVFCCKGYQKKDWEGYGMNLLTDGRVTDSMFFVWTGTA